MLNRRNIDEYVKCVLIALEMSRHGIRFNRQLRIFRAFRMQTIKWWKYRKESKYDWDDVRSYAVRRLRSA